ncbi:MAG: thioredoxin family protein [Planctomycetota bacterium]|nr:MAG: thioredoxin family protein [Planctomycetota bacterium]
MSRVQILGTGCAKCEKLAQRAREVLDGLGSDAELVKVKEIEDIVALGAMLTPALAVDDKVLLAGRVPSTKELSQILSDALASGGSSS